ncbi:MAG: hypothetical protein SFU86_06685 [Pirellulaceae bacterium]|nr:hypothetical protein [Pirellulaceae bacterium]
MHARDLAELAALIAVHSPVLVEGAEPPLAWQEAYWAAARCRLDRWTRMLRRLAGAAGELPRPATLSWSRIRPLLEEILVAELLARLWAAVAAAHDARQGTANLAPVARNVLAGHLEARRRLLALLADSTALLPGEAAVLNQLRLRVERWNDVLLAHPARWIDVAEFAFDPDRAADFAADLAHAQSRDERELAAQLVVASLRASLASSLADPSPSSDLNRRIGTAILGCYQGELFAAPAPASPLWIEQMSAIASDTQAMIDELVRLDALEYDAASF